MKNLMMVTLVLLAVAVISGCATSPPHVEPIVKTVYVERDPETLPIQHPELPESVSTPNIKMGIVTIKTIFREVISTVESNTELTSEDKEIMVTYLDTALALQLAKDPLIYQTLSPKEAEKFKIYLEKTVGALEKMKRAIEYYRETDAVILVK